MERLANVVGSLLAEQLSLDDDRREQVAYGAYVLLQSGSTFLLILALSAALGVLPQTLIVAVAAAFLRFYSGGVHLRGALPCVIASALAFALCGLAAKELTEAVVNAPLWLRFLGFTILSLASFLVVMRYAPVEAAMRPLSATHKKKVRQASILIASVYSVVVIVAGSVSAWWSVPALFGFGFQCFSLTPAGHRFITALDKGLSFSGRR